MTNGNSNNHNQAMMMFIPMNANTNNSNNSNNPPPVIIHQQQQLSSSSPVVNHNNSNNVILPAPPLTSNNNHSISSNQQQQHQHHQNPQPPLIVINGVPPHVPLIKLYLLLEVYGVCYGLRRQPQFSNQILARFENMNDATLCVKHLNNAPFLGGDLHIRMYNHLVHNSLGEVTQNNNLVSFHAENGKTDPSSTECLCFDFTHYRHRGRPHHNGGVTGKKFNPTPFLFVANLTEDIDESDIRNFFAQHGYEVQEFARKRLEFGIVSLKDTATAVSALIEMHSSIIKDRYLRITFSGFPPNSLPPGVDAKQLQQEQAEQQRLIEQKLKEKREKFAAAAGGGSYHQK